MNTYLLLSVLSVFCLCCSSKCPKIIKKHKELISGIIVGLVLCSFFGVNLNNVEGFEVNAFLACMADSDAEIPSGSTKGDYCLCVQDATLPGCNPPTTTTTSTPPPFTFGDLASTDTIPAG